MKAKIINDNTSNGIFTEIKTSKFEIKNNLF